MKEVNYIDVSEKIQKQLQQGAFLTVKDNDGNINTMTIAWGIVCPFVKTTFFPKTRCA